MDLNYYLDIFGQQPGFSNLYTQITCCFSVTNGSSQSEIIGILNNGLERLSTSFPWLAGQVVNQGSSPGNSGIFTIKKLENIPRIVVKNLQNESSELTMEALRRAYFPFSILDESIIAPRNTLPGDSDESTSPVFLIQATFITGGLLLTFVGQHNVMDMTGQSQIMNQFSKACCNEQFTSEELVYGNLDRCNIVPFLDDSYDLDSELAHQTQKPNPYPNDIETDAEVQSPPNCSWAYFIFSPTSLAALKSLATNALNLTSGYISTDDILSSFIWKSIVRARVPRLNPTNKVSFARAVDPRRYLNIPPTYPGVVQNMTYHTYTVQKLDEEPLGSVASQLRSSVDPKTSNLGHQTRALATLLNRTPDKTIISVAAALDLSADIMLSSWAKYNFYELDFGLGLGRPEAVRRPRFLPFESLVYFMPKKLDGEIAVAFCLRDEDMDRLKVDKEFAKYGRYIG